jgi:hypothetical protein
MSAAVIIMISIISLTLVSVSVLSYRHGDSPFRQILSWFGILCTFFATSAMIALSLKPKSEYFKPKEEYRMVIIPDTLYKKVK